MKKKRKISNYADVFAFLLLIFLLGVSAGLMMYMSFGPDTIASAEGEEVAVEAAEVVSEPEISVDTYRDIPKPVSIGQFTVTAYCPCQKCCGKTPSDPAYGITASGAKAKQGRTIAVDPEVIPLGSVVYFEGTDGLIGGYVAEDTGGVIKGNRIDLYFDSHEDALEWGVRYKEVFMMEEAK